MKNLKEHVLILTLGFLLFFGLNVNAADEREGTIVDGSVLLDNTEVVEYISPLSEAEIITRGTYLSSGSGRLTIKGTRYVNVFGFTDCNRTSDEVKVTLYLQRLVGNTWSTVYTLGPKVAKNATYVSNSKNYTVTGGYYYRVYGSHSAKKGSTTEATASYTNGLWIK